MESMLYELNQIGEVCVHDWLAFNETHHMYRPDMFFYRDMLMMLARKEGWMKQREFEII
jgi:hypothetical protein